MDEIDEPYVPLPRPLKVRCCGKELKVYPGDICKFKAKLRYNADGVKVTLEAPIEVEIVHD